MKIAAATSCSNEGRYLLEWVAHYIILGVKRFYIFTHNNVEDEAFVDAKAKLETLGFVTFIESERTGETRCFQMDNFCRARDMAKREGFDWLWCSDIDEYLVLTRHESASSFLREFPVNVAQVSLNWLIFGSNGEKDFDASRLHFERFSRHAPIDHPDHIYVKSFVRPDRSATMQLHIHDVRGNRVTSSGLPLRMLNSCGAETDFSCGYVAHFSIRSRGEFEAKQSRGYASEIHTTKIDEEYWLKRDANDLAAPPLTYHKLQLKMLLASWAAGSVYMHSFTSPNPNPHENQILDLPPYSPRFRPCS